MIGFMLSYVILISYTYLLAYAKKDKVFDLY